MGEYSLLIILFAPFLGAIALIFIPRQEELILEPTDPLCLVPTRTRHKRAPWSLNPKKMGSSDPTHRMNDHLSDSEVWELICSGVLWYFPVHPKKPFKIPIPSLNH